ncbi:hypothetical protein DPMN_119703 [Dreissena polymorpha]|uniref:Uncharacterized protein n=1 Tax=Dreissena polymorpha TaxID=45954 RepID=A0A9D4JS59_DREPO|nr:hypothetical protein DPMN_119703 [Dreissena polymorpha]
MDSTVKEPLARAHLRRSRNLTEEGMDLYVQRRNQFNGKQEAPWTLVENSMENDNANIKEVYLSYVSAADNYLEFLPDTYTDESLNLRSKSIDTCE